MAYGDSSYGDRGYGSEAPLGMTLAVAATVTGLVSGITLTAPAGSVGVGASGDVAIISLDAPAGAFGPVVFGTVASVSMVAPTGSTSIGVAGVVAVIATAAPAGYPVHPVFYHAKSVRSARSDVMAVDAHIPTITGSFDFTVAASSGAAPTDATPPTPTPAVANRWRFEDPVTSEIYLLPVNPHTASTPERIRKITETTTTTGQPISHEGSREAVVWTLTGWVYQKAELDALTTWSRKPNKIYLTDDLGRIWIAYIRDFQPIQKLNMDVYFASYTMHILIYGDHL